MTELTTSLLFAFLFIMAYLCIAKLRNSKTLGAPSLMEMFQSSGKGSKAIAGKKPELFLTTKELSAHHSANGPGASQRLDRQ